LVRIRSAAGCVTIDTQKVVIAEKADIYVPTAFTPNRDGRNDILRPVLMGIKELKYFRVYSRWGELLFETKMPALAGMAGTRVQSKSREHLFGLPKALALMDSCIREKERVC